MSIRPLTGGLVFIHSWRPGSRYPTCMTGTYRPMGIQSRRPELSVSPLNRKISNTPALRRVNGGERIRAHAVNLPVMLYPTRINYDALGVRFRKGLILHQKNLCRGYVQDIPVTVGTLF